MEQNINSSTGVENKLYDPTKKAKQLVKIECKACGHIGDPQKWSFVWICGIVYFFILNVFGLLVYFLIANPYICKNCNQRNQLAKVLNNDQRMLIKHCLSRKAFIAVSIVILLIAIPLVILKIIT